MNIAIIISNVTSSFNSLPYLLITFILINIIAFFLTFNFCCVRFFEEQNYNSLWYNALCVCTLKNKVVIYSLRKHLWQIIHNMNISNCDLKSQSNFKVKESNWNRKLIQNIYLAVLRGFAIVASAPTPSASASCFVLSA